VPRAIVCERRKQTGSGVAAGSVAVALIGLLIAPAAAVAQDTRAAEIAQQQADKAATAAPSEPNRFDRLMTSLERGFASPPGGVFPYFGSVYSGGGFTLGAGYRQFYAREAVWEIKGLYSIKNYKLIEFGTRAPWNYNGRFMKGIRVGYRDAPQVGFYGIGPDSTADDRANFRLETSYLAGDLAFRPSPWSRLDLEVAYEDVRNEGGSGRAPSIETVYDATTAPGLFEHLTFVRSRGAAAIDWRVSPGYSRTGGFYGATFNDFSDLDKTYSFQRMDGEVIQHVPILRETWVLTFRGRVQSVVDDGDTVPYYLLPSLGSGSTLRGYSTARFRDRHSILTSGEFRWIPNRLALDLALFYDAGKVTARRQDLDFTDLTTNWGIGVRFHGPTATPLRIEIARGGDGWHLVFSGNAAF
jgi:hypothetical protein